MVGFYQGEEERRRREFVLGETTCSCLALVAETNTRITFLLCNLFIYANSSALMYRSNISRTVTSSTSEICISVE